MAALAMSLKRAARCAALLLCWSVGSAMPDEAAERQLIVSAINGNVEGVGQALKNGASINVRDSRGRTALLIATHADNVEMARMLIAAGADVNARDHIEDSPYLYAGAEGRNEILRMTLEAGADLRSTNRYGGTALIPAAHHGHPETVAILLRTRIDKDHVNKLGWTALLEAVILGDGGPTYARIVQMLVKAGANTNIADRNGATPLAHARARNLTEIAKTLEAAGAR